MGHMTVYDPIPSPKLPQYSQHPANNWSLVQFQLVPSYFHCLIKTHFGLGTIATT